MKIKVTIYEKRKPGDDQKVLRVLDTKIFTTIEKCHDHYAKEYPGYELSVIEADEEEEKYIEVAIRMKKSDWDNLSDDIHKKMWDREDGIIHLETDCEVLAFGVDGFISGKLG